MKLNWKKFFLTFALIECVFLLAGCTASWLGAVTAMLPTLEAAVSAIIAFVAALEGKTLSSDIVAKIKSYGDAIAAEIVQVQDLVNTFKQNATSGLLGQIQAVLNQVVTDPGNILAAANVTDTSTVAKITQFVGLAVAAVQAILALIPVAVTRMEHGATQEELVSEDKLATRAINDANSALKETYTAIREDKTTNLDVNEALDGLPASI